MDDSLPKVLKQALPRARTDSQGLTYSESEIEAVITARRQAADTMNRLMATGKLTVQAAWVVWRYFVSGDATYVAQAQHMSDEQAARLDAIAQ